MWIGHWHKGELGNFTGWQETVAILDNVPIWRVEWWWGGERSSQDSLAAWPCPPGADGTSLCRVLSSAQSAQLFFHHCELNFLSRVHSIGMQAKWTCWSSESSSKCKLVLCQTQFEVISSKCTHWSRPRSSKGSPTHIWVTPPVFIVQQWQWSESNCKPRFRAPSVKAPYRRQW